MIAQPQQKEYSPRKTYDILVVGGGLVGMTAAIACAGAGLCVALVDREDPRLFLTAPFDGRSSAIARGSRQILEGLGLWRYMADKASPIHNIRVSDGRAGPLGSTGWTSGLYLHYDADDLDGSPLGFIVENRVIREALSCRLETLSDLTVFAPAQLATLTRNSYGVQATLTSGLEIKAALVVAADGRNSGLRKSAGIAVDSWDYPQVGIVTTVGHGLPHGGVAHEHFLPSGPFALLPMTCGPLVDCGPDTERSSLVWTERREIAKSVMALDDTDFAAELQRRFGSSLGKLTVAGKRWCYPLSLLHARSYTAERLILVGDAAHAIHPIAGQGFNLGIRDVAVLAEAVVDAARLGLDIGGAQVAADYERWRRFDAVTLVVVTDLLNRLFSNDIAPLRFARDFGLAAVNQLPPVKRFFMRHAMGLVGELPRLTRGEPL
ncbi:MAG: UbiH/UbiF/VisC/COQ6 family ubiquinone biosynthesis hydroxylase [Kiloniellales bacterium]|nr:UbiH/UbiF/VisC/COQ6 family ubiquinone biosynthesis hydroxylase [Kiloniellales bacterium]